MPSTHGEKNVLQNYQVHDRDISGTRQRHIRYIAGTYPVHGGDIHMYMYQVHGRDIIIRYTAGTYQVHGWDISGTCRDT